MSTTTSTQPLNESGRQPGRHPVNVGHLVMGIAFLGLAGVWALIQTEVVGDGDVRWLLPVPWVLAGLAGLLAVGLSGSKRWSTRQTGWVGTESTDLPGSPDSTADEITVDTTVLETETTETADSTDEETR